MNNPPIEYYPRLLIIDSKLTRTLMHIKLKTIVYNLPTDQRIIFKRFKMTRNQKKNVSCYYCIVGAQNRTILFNIINCRDGEFFSFS